VGREGAVVDGWKLCEVDVCGKIDEFR